MKTRKDTAMELFDNGCNCSQAVLLSFARDFGLEKDMAVALSVPFGGGMSKQGKTCGCLSGALMVIGLCFGKKSTEIIANRGLSYRMGAEFIKRFREKFEATDCRDLIKLDLNKKADLEEATKNVFGSRCKNMVGNTVELLEQFLEEKQAEMVL